MLAHRYAQARMDQVRLSLAWSVHTGKEGSEALRSELEDVLELCQSMRLGVQNEPAALPEVHLTERCGLTPTELELLWLLMTLQLQPDSRLWAGLPPGLLGGQLTGALCLQLLPRSMRTQWDPSAAPRLDAQGTLLHFGLIESSLDDPHPMQGNWRVTHQAMAFLQGERILSPELGRSGRWIVPQVRLGDIASPQADLGTLERTLGAYWQRHHNADQPAPWFGHAGLAQPQGLAVVLRGQEGSGRLFALKAIAQQHHRNLIEVDGALLATEPLETQRRALQRAFQEAALYAELLVLRDADRLMEHAPWLRRQIQDHRAAVALCIDALTVLPARLNHIAVLEQTWKPASSTQETLWWLNLPQGDWLLDEAQMQPVTGKTTLLPVQVRNANHLTALWTDSHQNPQALGRAFQDATTAQVDRGSDPLADGQIPAVSMEDLIVSAPLRGQIDEIVAAISHRRRVFEEWGLKDKLRRGLAITCLFDGEPGTGKTLTAEVLAGSLGLRLMKVNTSQIVDKYIGETEKNLTRLFERVRPDVHLLLFDEADSLFSRRTQKIERSTDRYSNMDINVLLQQIESFEGIAVLTTNLKKSIDPAFERRITFKVHFELPGPAERARIWQRLVPTRACDDVDFQWLSEIEVSGGEIKNAVLKAAYRAARRGQRLDTRTLYEAAVAEARVAGRLVRDDGG
mgnify:CR=1 FL=1